MLQQIQHFVETNVISYLICFILYVNEKLLVYKLHLTVKWTKVHYTSNSMDGYDLKQERLKCCCFPYINSKNFKFISYFNLRGFF